MARERRDADFFERSGEAGHDLFEPAQPRSLLFAAAAASTLAALNDTDTASVAPTDGQALVWSAADSLWKPGTVAAGGALDDLTDVDAGSPTDEQVLSWSDADSAWTPSSLTSLVSEYDDTDVGAYLNSLSAAAWNLITNFAGAVGAWWGATANALIAWLRTFDNTVRSTVNSLIDWYEDISNPVQEWIENLPNNIAALWNTIKAAATWVASAAANILSTVTGWAESVWTGLTNFGNAVATSLGAIWASIESMGETIWGIIDGTAEAVWTWIAGLSGAIATGISFAGTWVASAATNIQNTVAGWTASVWEGFSALSTAIGTALGAAWTWLADIYANSEAVVDSLLAWYTDAVRDSINTARNWVASATSNVTAILNAFTSSAWEGLANFGDAVEGVLGATWTAVEAFFADTAGAIETALGASWTWLKAIYANSEAAVDSLLAWYSDAVRDSINTARNWVAAAATNVGNIVAGWSATVWSAFSAFPTAVEAALGATWDWLHDNLAALQAIFSDTVGTLAATLTGWLVPFADESVHSESGTTGDLDLKTWDLVRADRIFFESNDGLNTASSFPHITGGGANMFFFVPDTQHFSWYTGGTASDPALALTTTFLATYKPLRLLADYSGAEDGVMWFDDPHVKVYTGGGPKSLSDIGEWVGTATSDLAMAQYDITGIDRLEFNSDTTFPLGPTKPNLSGFGNSLYLSVPSSESIYAYVFNKQIMRITGSTAQFLYPVWIRNTDDNKYEGTGDGFMWLEGGDIKVRTGGAEKSLSDIGTGTGEGGTVDADSLYTLIAGLDTFLFNNTATGTVDHDSDMIPIVDASATDLKRVSPVNLFRNTLSDLPTSTGVTAASSLMFWLSGHVFRNTVAQTITAGLTQAVMRAFITGLGAQTVSNMEPLSDHMIVRDDSDSAVTYKIPVFRAGAAWFDTLVRNSSYHTGANTLDRIAFADQDNSWAQRTTTMQQLREVIITEASLAGVLHGVGDVDADDMTIVDDDYIPIIKANNDLGKVDATDLMFNIFRSVDAGTKADADRVLLTNSAFDEIKTVPASGFGTGSVTAASLAAIFNAITSSGPGHAAHIPYSTDSTTLGVATPLTLWKAAISNDITAIASTENWEIPVVDSDVLLTYTPAAFFGSVFKDAELETVVSDDRILFADTSESGAIQYTTPTATVSAGLAEGTLAAVLFAADTINSEDLIIDMTHFIPVIESATSMGKLTTKDLFFNLFRDVTADTTAANTDRVLLTNAAFTSMKTAPTSVLGTAGTYTLTIADFAGLLSEFDTNIGGTRVVPIMNTSRNEMYYTDINHMLRTATLASELTYGNIQAGYDYMLIYDRSGDPDNESATSAPKHTSPEAIVRATMHGAGSGSIASGDTIIFLDADDSSKLKSTTASELMGSGTGVTQTALNTFIGGLTALTYSGISVANDRLMLRDAPVGGQTPGDAIRSLSPWDLVRGVFRHLQTGTIGTGRIAYIQNGNTGDLRYTTVSGILSKANFEDFMQPLTELDADSSDLAVSDHLLLDNEDDGEIYKISIETLGDKMMRSISTTGSMASGDFILYGDDNDDDFMRRGRVSDILNLAPSVVDLLTGLSTTTTVDIVGTTAAERDQLLILRNEDTAYRIAWDELTGSADIDLGTHDLLRVDNIRFDGNDFASLASTNPHIGADLNTLREYAPSGGQIQWYIGTQAIFTATNSVVNVSVPFNIAGAAASSPLNGQMWKDTNDVIVRTGGTSVNLSNVASALTEEYLYDFIGSNIASSGLGLVHGTANIDPSNDFLILRDANEDNSIYKTSPYLLVNKVLGAAGESDPTSGTSKIWHETNAGPKRTTIDTIVDFYEMNDDDFIGYIDDDLSELTHSGIDDIEDFLIIRKGSDTGTPNVPGMYKTTPNDLIGHLFDDSGVFYIDPDYEEPANNDRIIFWNSSDDHTTGMEWSALKTLLGGGSLTTSALDTFFDDTLDAIDGSNIDYDDDHLIIQDDSSSISPIRKITPYELTEGVFRGTPEFSSSTTTRYRYQFTFQDHAIGARGLTNDGTSVYAGTNMDKYNTSGQSVAYTQPSGFTPEHGYTVYDDKFYAIDFFNNKRILRSRAIDGTGSNTIVIDNSAFHDFNFEDVAYGSSSFWFISTDSATVRAYSTTGDRQSSKDFTLPFNPNGISFHGGKLWFINDSGLRQIRVFSTSGTESTSQAIDLEDPEDDSARTYVYLTVMDDGIAVGYWGTNGSSTFNRIHWYAEETVTASAISGDDTLLFLSDSDQVVRKGSVAGLLALVEDDAALNLALSEDDMYTSIYDNLTTGVPSVTDSGGDPHTSFPLNIFLPVAVQWSPDSIADAYRVSVHGLYNIMMRYAVEKSSSTVDDDNQILLFNTAGTVRNRITLADLATSFGSSGGGDTVDLGDVSQSIVPSSDHDYNLGSSDNKWDDVWAYDVRATRLLYHGDGNNDKLGLFGTTPRSQLDWGNPATALDVAGRNRITLLNSDTGISLATKCAATINQIIDDLQAYGLFGTE